MQIGFEMSFEFGTRQIVQCADERQEFGSAPARSRHGARRVCEKGADGEIELFGRRALSHGVPPFVRAESAAPGIGAA